MTVEPGGGLLVRPWRQRLGPLDPDVPEVGTTKCSACSWTFSGAIMEGAALHREHRKAKHFGTLKASTTRAAIPGKRGAASRAPDTAERVSVLVKALEERAMTSRELAKLVPGMSPISVGVALAWARKNNECAARLYPQRGRGQGLWSLTPIEDQPPPPPVRNVQPKDYLTPTDRRRRARTETALRAMLEVMADGKPRTAQELGAALGLSGPSIAGILRHGRKTHPLIFTKPRDGHCVGTWHLESPSEIN